MDNVIIWKYSSIKLQDVLLLNALVDANLIQLTVQKEYIEDDIPTNYYYPWLSSLECIEMCNRLDNYIHQDSDNTITFKALDKCFTDIPTDLSEWRKLEYDIIYYLGVFNQQETGESDE